MMKTVSELHSTPTLVVVLSNLENCGFDTRVSDDCVVLNDSSIKWAVLLSTNPVFYSLSNEENHSFLGPMELPLGGATEF